MRSPSHTTATPGDVGSSMTPMIDVVFQLLIYFLCTASFQLAEQSLPTTLPPTGSVAYTPPKEVQELELVRIALSQNGANLTIELNGNPCATILELRNRLQQLLSVVALPAVLDIGPEVEIGHLVTVYDTCLLVGFRDIHFAAPEQERS